MNHEKLREIYRREGWGVMAEAAGCDTVNTESSARSAFGFAHGLLKNYARHIAEIEGTHFLGMKGAASLEYTDGFSEAEKRALYAIRDELEDEFAADRKARGVKE